jgi:hypothetical protein
MADPGSHFIRGLRVLGQAGLCAMLVGCVDFGHMAAYKLALGEAPRTGVSGQRSNELQRTVRQTLLHSGFKEATGRQTIWLKDGATVMLEPTEGGELLLKLKSMGSASRVRSAALVETDLVNALKESQIAVTPAILPEPTAK